MEGTVVSGAVADLRESAKDFIDRFPHANTDDVRLAEMDDIIEKTNNVPEASQSVLESVK